MTTEEEPRKVSLGRYELLEFARNELAFFGLELERISSLFLAQILQIKTRRSVDIFSITDELKALEGVGPKTQTKKEQPFNSGTLLEGLYYKHFTDARFIAKNFASEFGCEKGGNKTLRNLIGRLVYEHRGEYVNDGFAEALAHESTVGALRRRAKRGGLTGEWIVFAKRRDKRYYLCLAAHEDSNEVIRSRADSAKDMDFAFLKVDA